MSPTGYQVPKLQSRYRLCPPPQRFTQFAEGNESKWVALPVVENRLQNCSIFPTAYPLHARHYM